MSGVNIFELHVCYKKLELVSGNSTQEDEEYVNFLQKSVSVDQILWPVEIALSVLSTFISVINTVVLTRKTMLYSSLNVLLVALESSNIVLAIFQLKISIMRFLIGQYNSSSRLVIMDTVAAVLTFTSAYFMNWLTVVIGAWRFLAVTWPLKASAKLNKKHALMTIAVLALVSIMPAIFFALLNELDSSEINVCSRLTSNSTVTTTYHHLSSTEWAANNYHTVDKIIITINVLYYLLPCVCFVFITAGLIWNICQHSMRQKFLREGQSRTYIEEGQTRTNIILMIMLSFFLSSNTVPVIVRLIWLSGKAANNDLFYFLTYVLSSYPLSLLTNSLSFFAYYSMGTKFRDTFHEIFRK